MSAISKYGFVSLFVADLAVIELKGVGKHLLLIHLFKDNYI